MQKPITPFSITIWTLGVLLPSILRDVESVRTNLRRPDSSLLQTQLATKGFMGTNYVVPSPTDLGTLADYQNLISACATNTSSTGCQAALTQMVSDIRLIIPDTQTYLQSMSDQIASNQQLATNQQGAINILGQQVAAISSNLISTNNALTNSNAQYSSNANTLSTAVSQAVDQTNSPAYIMANAQQQVMLDQINALQQAVETYLQSQKTYLQNTADSVYTLYQNDQAIIQANANTQLQAAQNTAATLTNAIQNLRSYYQGNVTIETNNLNNQKLLVSQAQTNANSAFQAAQATIASTVTSTIAAAMTNVQNAFQQQVTNLSNYITSMGTNATKLFDTAFSYVNAYETNVTQAIAANITAAQANLTNVQTLLGTQLTAASTSYNNLNQTMSQNQQANQQRANSAIATLNDTLSQYLNNSASVTGQIFSESQNFMNQFANLANAASEQSSSSMQNAATNNGNSMSSLNSYIGQMSQSAYSQSSSSASAMAGAIASSQDSVATMQMKQILALADSINTIKTLVSLLKAKIGLSSDTSDSKISSMSDMINYAVNSVSGTIQAISNQIAAQSLTISANQKTQLDAVTAAANTAKTNAANQMSSLMRSLNTQIAGVASSRTSAGSTAQKIISNIGSLANTLSNANKQLGTNVNNTLATIQSQWAPVDTATAAAISGITTALSGLIKYAYDLSSSQLQTGNSYMNSQMQIFKTAYNTAQSDANLDAQYAWGNVSNSSTVVMKGFNSTIDVTQAYLASTLSAADAALTTLGRLATTLIAMEASEESKMRNITTNTSDVMKSQIDLVKQNLLNQVQTALNAYHADAKPKLVSVQSAISKLNDSFVAELGAIPGLLPDGSDIFNMTDSDFRTQITNAQNLVSTASKNEASRFAALSTNLTNSYNALVNSMNLIDSQLSVISPNAQAAVSQALSDAQQVIANNVSAFNSYSDLLYQKVVEDDTKQVDTETSTTNANVGIFSTALKDAKNKTDTVWNTVNTVSEAEQQKQAMLADMMDQIIAVLSSVSIKDAAELQAIQSDFAKLKAESVGVGSSLSASVNNAVSSLSIISSATQAKNQETLTNSNNQAMSTMNSVSSKLSAAIAALNAGNAAEFASEQADNADALKLAQYLSELGGTAQAEVQEIISKIQEGQLSLSDYLSSQADLTSAQISTAQDLIVAFSAALQNNVQKVKRVYDGETDKLDVFSDTVTSAFSTYESSRLQAIASLQDLVKEANDTATSFNETSAKTLDDAHELLSQVQGELTSTTASLPSKLNQLKESIKAAVLQVEASQDTIANNLIAQASQAKDTIVANVASFGSSSGHQPSNYVYQVSQVDLPTVPPELVVDFKY